MANSNDGAGAPDRSGVVVGVALILLAGVLLWDAANLNRAVAYGFGPEVVPRVIATGLALLGAASILSGLRGRERKPGAFHVGAVATVCGGFVALTACIGLGGGFIPAMTILFAVTSLAFGRYTPHIDLAIGLVMSTLTYFVFSKLLALSLPQGPLERLIG